MKMSTIKTFKVFNIRKLKCKSVFSIKGMRQND